MVQNTLYLDSSRVSHKPLRDGGGGGGEHCSPLWGAGTWCRRLGESPAKSVGGGGGGGLHYF